MLQQPLEASKLHVCIKLEEMEHCICTEHFFRFPRVEVLLRIQSCVIPGSLIFCKGDHVPNPNVFVVDHLWREYLHEL